MCGIIGYIGYQRPEKVLLQGLGRLQYRGYDSAGLSLLNKEELQTIKCVGTISDLEKQLEKSSIINSNLGIAHTRWATHGSVSKINSHPHTVGTITIVHNGIIENVNDLKNKLQHQGYQFKSETDSEVLAALIDYNYQNDIIKAISKSLNQIIGSYALGILVDKDTEHLYATRKDSSLIVGIGEEENFIASDINAILEFTDKYVNLEEGEIAVLGKGEWKVLNAMGKKVEKNINIEKKAIGSISKGQFSHYMLKEIMEQPFLLESTLKNIIKSKESLIDTMLDISDYEEIHVVACGSSLYAGMIGKNLIEKYVGIPTKIEAASEYRYSNIIYNRKTLAIFISQSGQTADTIAALRKTKKEGIATLGIVNEENSTIAKEVDNVIFTKAGIEVAVATTKAYILQVTYLSLLALKGSVMCGKLDNEKVENILYSFRMLPDLLKDILQRDYKGFALQLYQTENAFFIGRQIDYALCLEGSLKLKEIAYIHSEAYQAGELKHGTISLIQGQTPVIAVITNSQVKEKMTSNIEEVKSRGAKCIIITTDELDTFSDMKIVVNTVNEFVQPLLIIPVLQLLSYETAKLRNCEIDYPRNLAKSVTVE